MGSALSCPHPANHGAEKKETFYDMEYQKKRKLLKGI